MKGRPSASLRCIVIAGPNVERRDVLRRFERGWQNFVTAYRPLADAWAVYDNSGRLPHLLEVGP